MPTFTSTSACSLIVAGSGEQSESCSKDIWAYEELDSNTWESTDNDETSASPDRKGINEVWVTELIISEPLLGSGKCPMKAPRPVFQKYL